MSSKHYLPLLIIFMYSSVAVAQVKIGDTTGAPDPKAILELKDTTRGFLLPRMTDAHMNGIAAPTNGLLVFNTTNNSIYQYNQPATQWRPIIADSSEWQYDSGTGKLYLRRALNNADSFYYSTTGRKFIFADTRFYRSSTGVGAFNLDEGNSDRFIFKTTASRFPRPITNLNSANMYAIYEVDNDTAAVNNPFFANYLGAAADVTVIPSATQKIGMINGMRSFTTFGGADSLGFALGLYNAVSLRGKGYVDLAYGLQNIIGIRDSITNLGFVYGIHNSISYTSPLGVPRVLGNVYGYFGNMSAAMNGKVDGNAYNMFLGNVFAAGVGVNRNWSIFTNKGMNRFGDSVLITETGAQRARAVLDINSNSAMIIPVGPTATRPATAYAGMIRYNTDNSSPEAYTPGGWVNMKSTVIGLTAILDAPPLASGSTGSVIYPVPGAVFGNTVTVSPDTPLPSGLLIAWARVSGAGLVEVSFGNISGAPLDHVAHNYYIKVIQ